jgi:hypothetical protein
VWLGPNSSGVVYPNFGRDSRDSNPKYHQQRTKLTLMASCLFDGDDDVDCCSRIRVQHSTWTVVGIHTKRMSWNWGWGISVYCR